MISRKRLIQIFTFLGGIYYFLEFVLPKTVFGIQIDKYDDQISNGFIAIGAVAIGLGLINIVSAHGSQIIYKRKGAINSFALLLGMLLMAWVTILDWGASLDAAALGKRFFHLRDFALKIQADAKAMTPGVLPFEARNKALKRAVLKETQDLRAELSKFDTASIPKDAPSLPLLNSTKEQISAKLTELEAALSGLLLEHKVGAELSENAALGRQLGEIGALATELKNLRYQFSQTKQAYEFLYDGLFISLGSAMFALLGFYIASAAYRAFRVKSVESGLMLAAALVVMLGQIPFGIWIWHGFPELRLWILEVPNAAAFRAVKFGAAVAGLVMAFRMWLSIESESFSEKSR